MIKVFQTYQTLLFFIFVLLLSFATIKPLFSDGYFPMHDDTQVSRVFVMKEALSDGQFPVRMIEGLGYGYGYPLFNFYSPGPYYIGGFFAFIFSPLAATKIMMGIGMVLAGVSMYFLSREFFGKWYAVIPAALYLFAPYHAVQLYVRGAVAELWAYGVLPFVVLFLHKTLKEKRIWWIVLLGVLYAVLMLSHNITAFLASGFIGIWVTGMLVWHRDFSAVKRVSIGIILGLLLSAFFWLPAILESNLTKIDRLISEVYFDDHFLFLDQLWSSPWGFAGSAPGRADGMSFVLGKAHILLATIGIITLFFSQLHKKTKKSNLGLAIGIISTMLLSTVMMFPVSQIIWRSTRLLQFVQFPWRFLIFVNFTLALLSGFIAMVRDKIPYVLQILGIFSSVILVLIINTKYFKPQFIRESDGSEYTMSEKLTWDVSKISDEYLPKAFSIPQKASELPAALVESTDTIKVAAIQRRSSSFSFTVETVEQTPEQLAINIAQFPRWLVTIEGLRDMKELITFSDGQLLLEIPTGSYTVHGNFINTPIRTIANLLSILGIGSIVTLLFYEKHFKKIIT